jgi:hypothetical protein
MPNLNAHQDRMEAFWAHLQEVQDRIDRAKRMIDESHREARAIQQEIHEQRLILREDREGHRCFRDGPRPPRDSD